MDVREIRRSLGMTQEELAKLVGVRVATVSRWENSKHKPSKLAQVVIRNVIATRQSNPLKTE